MNHHAHPKIVRPTDFHGSDHSLRSLVARTAGIRLLRVCASGLLFATGAIHLDLYLTGYRTIPTIGWLFLLQVVTAFGLGLAVLAIGGAGGAHGPRGGG